MNPKYANAAPIPATPEQQRKRDALVYWLVTGVEPEDAREHVAAFDMSDWRVREDCGAVCCMAGAVREWWGNIFHGAYGTATNLLGFDCYGDAIGLWYGPHTTDRLHAARVFQNYCETGVVDWEGMQ